MNAELVSELKTRARLTARARIVSALGPMTALAGIVWALVQPYRITLLQVCIPTRTRSSFSRVWQSYTRMT